MDSITLFCLLSVAVGLYTTWNIGANDVSNAMGTSVGSKSLTLRQAVIVAAICEFLGAWLFGRNVSQTLRSGIIDTDRIEMVSGHYSVPLGMLSSLLATGMWLNLASYWKLPVSTTHSIVGAIVGFGLISGGIHSVHWNTVFRIASSWIISPVLGGLGAYVLFSVIRKLILSKTVPLKAAERTLPWLFAIFSSSVSMIWLSAKTSHPSDAAGQSWSIFTVPIIFAATWFLFWGIQRKFHTTLPGEEKRYMEQMERLSWLQQRKSELLYLPKTEEIVKEQQWVDKELKEISKILRPAVLQHYEEKQFQRLEKLFGLLQVATAATMAFSHGANDVANGIGPLEAILQSLAEKNNWLSVVLVPHVLLLGGAGILIGLVTWGWRVIETIGKNITELTPSRGFSAEFGTSITILTASRLGLPISTTHTLVGAVIGVGLAGGISALNIKTLREIVASWVITIPGGAILSIVWYELFQLFL